ncbi:MAG: UvrD-helicase domain-containing protein [Rhodospirillales bacterium]|nr:UvrD-helicase domain-containing protein [Rhodospirillales bacterium]
MAESLPLPRLPESADGTDSVRAVARLSVPPALLEPLNASPREAVETAEGPVLVLAGAGTGKTRVLTTRLAYLLLSGRGRPNEILAVTFTNKAAREMRERVARLLGRPVEGWWVGTFHAIAARILRAHAEAAGLRSDFTILDEDDQIRLLKQLIEARRLDEKRWPARALNAVIQRWKDRGLTPDRVSAAEGAGTADGRALEIYADYQERLKALNAADFGDLLLHNLEIFRTVPAVLERYQRQFRYLLVDEYQDSNVAQYLWLRLLAQRHSNLCCVGDDDQSIYSWRGAEIGNILRFEVDFPGAKVVRLERNYRSTLHILAAASGLIAHNRGRLGKTLWTDSDDAGEKIRVIGVWDGEAEARTVCEEIESLHGRGHALNDVAILVRASFQTREFEERMVSLAIPYRVVGGVRFYERAEIRDGIAYLRVVAQPADDLAFERIVNVPRRGLGPATLQTIHLLARNEGRPLLDSARLIVATDELKPKVRSTLAALVQNFDRWRGLVGTLPHGELAGQVLEESGYVAMLKADRSPEAPGRLENLKELVAAMEEFGSLAAFLEHVALVMDNDASDAEDKVSLMTLHGAKGLEFATVFLPGWEEGLFPHQRALDEGGEAALEEERRLAYVGLTRAKKRAYVTFAANRRVYNQWQTALASRFVGELPADHVEYADETGLYGRPASGAFAGRGRWHGFAEEDVADGRSALRARRGTRMQGRFGAEGQERSFAVGERVFHPKFGYGRVRSADGDRLDIEFEKAGAKRVLAGFVETV